MLKIASSKRLARARRRATAANDEPYSTIRRSPRWYQTRCGIRWTSGWAPVAIDDRQTGVSEGNVEIRARVGAVRGEELQRGHPVVLGRALERGRGEAVDHDQDQLLGHFQLSRASVRRPA